MIESYTTRTEELAAQYNQTPEHTKYKQHEAYVDFKQRVWVNVLPSLVHCKSYVDIQTNNGVLGHKSQGHGNAIFRGRTIR